MKNINGILRQLTIWYVSRRIVPLVGFRFTDALSASLQYLWRDFRMNIVLARAELAEMQAKLLDILHGKNAE